MASAADLTKALAAATPGAVVVLAAGTYRGHFTTQASGSAAAPIVLCGPRDAVLDGGDLNSGYGLHLDGASWWTVTGITVQNSQKGIVTDRATHVTLSNLAVHNVGDEGIHLRDFTTDSTIDHVAVTYTGLHESKFGEGIYIGTAQSNWATITHGVPDASDRNRITSSYVADTSAESIDIKEGTNGGFITDNVFSGVGMDPAATKGWVNVKGNGWTLTGNVGTDSPRDGFGVHVIVEGDGRDNVFRANVAHVNGPGYGIYVQSHNLGTHVACDNVVTDAGSGAYNVQCS